MLFFPKKAVIGGAAIRGTLVLGMNGSGTAVTGLVNPDGQSVDLVADNFGAQTWYNLGTLSGRGPSTSNIDEQQIVQTGNWGGWRWTSLLTNGVTYVCDLYFADFTSTGAGQRTFELHLQDTGTPVDGVMDIRSEAGGAGRIIKTAEFTASGTEFNIQILPVVGDGFLNAFALYQKV